MITVKDLLKEKGNQVYSIHPETTVFDALTIMAEKEVGALVVIKDQQVVGMFSERDYARKIVLKGKSSKASPVGELMSVRVFFIKPGKSIQDCMVLMTEKKIRHLPVMDNGQLLGLVSIGDVVNKIIQEQRSTIKDLENYIVGGYGSSSVII
ncbi:MAG: CBS domain-containing protein [Candidatus Cyclobacteriaceae bacterium M3_2C_046]